MITRNSAELTAEGAHRTSSAILLHPSGAADSRPEVLELPRVDSFSSLMTFMPLASGEEASWSGFRVQAAAAPLQS